jgi:hypothetical protein
MYNVLPGDNPIDEYGVWDIVKAPPGAPNLFALLCGPLSPLPPPAPHTFIVIDATGPAPPLLLPNPKPAVVPPLLPSLPNKGAIITRNLH